MIFKDKNYKIALELADCIIRLDYWLDKNEGCIGCRKGTGKKPTLYEKTVQWGKLYAYCYCLKKLEFAHFWHPFGELDNEEYVAILKNPFVVKNTQEVLQVFIKKKLFDEALKLNPLNTQKDILKIRAKRNEKNKSKKA